MPRSDDWSGVEKWSANGVCALRAAVFQEEERVRHGDCLAMELVSGTNRLLATLPVIRNLAWRLYNWWIPGVAYLHLARTRYFDARVRRALQTGATSLVVLAAGLDSRAHRLVGPSVRCFELDLPTNSRLKQARVAQVLGDAAARVQYVAADLAHPAEGLAALAKAGLEDDADAVFTLEGCSMYLELSDVRALLRQLTQRRGRSQLILDWFDAAAVESQGVCWRSRRHFRQMARNGERYTLGLDAGSVRELAREFGFRVLDVVERDEVDRRWCTDGDVVRRGMGFTGMAHLVSDGVTSGNAVSGE